MPQTEQGSGSSEQLQRKARNSPRRTRVTKAPEARRQEIVETALELFSEKGYEDTTIQDIVDRMKVSPGLCYKYFRSKREIFAAASEYYAMKAVEQIQIPDSDEMPAIEKLSLLIQQIFEYVMKHKEFEADYHKETELRASRLDHAAGQMATIMVPIVEQGVQEGTLHCEDISNTTKFLVFGIIHMFHNELPSTDAEAYIVQLHRFTKQIMADVLKIQQWPE